MHLHLTRHHREVEQLTSRLIARGPGATLERYRAAIQSHQGQVILLMRHRLTQEREQLVATSRTLATLSPLGVLNRGYSITTKIPEGWIVSEAERVRAGDNVAIQLSHGRLQARVEKIIPDNKVVQGQTRLPLNQSFVSIPREEP